MKYHSWTLGQMEALINRIGKENAVKLLSCNEVTVQFLADRRAILRAALPKFKIWTTITIGTRTMSFESFCSEFERHRLGISDSARDILKQKSFMVTTEEKKIDLVRLSVADLGFAGGANYGDICVQALEIGLELCPAEVGPRLCLQYPDQPIAGDRLVIAMKAIRATRGGLCVFAIEHDIVKKRWLYGYYGNTDYRWDIDTQFVFCFPSKVCLSTRQKVLGR